ncbi:MAG: hypothetical protein IKF47_03290 [Bacilli bacterium]|nr:hypothetical protein [Bacilli bacterium]
MKNRKRNKLFILVIILLGITIGYAALTSTLKINGSTAVTKNTWNIYWDNIANQDGVTPITSQIVSENANHPNNIVNFEVAFDKPGDYYEFTVDAVNAGTLDAMITDIELKVNDNPIIDTVNNSLVTVSPSPLPSYIKYTVTYADGEEIGLNHLLPKMRNNVETTKTYKIRVEYDKEAVTNDTLVDENVEYSFSFAVTYGQADSNAIDVRSCPGSDCVYAFYTAWTMYTGNNVATLSNYTSDYTTLKKDGVQRYAFFGHILDENDKILKAYACGIKDNKVFCIQGSNDGSTYQRASGILNNLFGPYNSTTQLGCNPGSNNLVCKAANETIEARAFQSGQVVVDEPKAICIVVNVGGMNCTEH